MSNIEKIRQEIERRKKENMYDDLPITIGRYYEDRDLLAFIDSLPEDDLSLSWEDMAKIDAIILDVNNEFAIDYSKEIDRQKFYEEVLKRFKETKDGQVHQATKE